jgi:hypothetical protein
MPRTDDRQSDADREEAMRDYREQKRIREEYLEDERDSYETED